MNRCFSPNTAAMPVASAVLLLSLLAAPSALRGHEEAVIESAQSSVAAGGTLRLNGKDFTGGESYALRLVGALREYDFGEVEPAEDGTFTLEVTIPREVTAGAYQLVAVAEDGDEVARMDLQVLAPNPAAEADHGEDAGGSQTGSVARSDDIQIERDRSGIEWGAIGLLVGLAGGLGLGLLRRRGA